jgi:hypothetical protein
MPLDRPSALLPSLRGFLTFVISLSAGAALAIVILAASGLTRLPTPDPGAARDARFAALGRAYLPRLGKAYSSAWEDGAKALEAGKGVSAALEIVSQSWSANRTKLYDEMLTPELAKIVAESVKDSDVTPSERAAMAAAWRGLSLGLAR